MDLRAQRTFLVPHFLAVQLAAISATANGGTVKNRGRPAMNARRWAKQEEEEAATASAHDRVVEWRIK